MELTIRQQIIELLKVKPTDAGTLSRSLGIKQRVVESHMEHVAKSVGKNFEITPPRCLDCGFIFKERSRSTKPSRCPMCKTENGITLPKFFVKE